MKNNLLVAYDNYKRLTKPKKVFFSILLLNCIFSIFLCVYLNPIVIVAMTVESILFIIIFFYLKNLEYNEKRWLIREIYLEFLIIFLVLELIAFFITTSRITFKRKLKDDVLLKMDQFLLGWIFEKGQLSLSLDKNNFLGPHKKLGRFINNTLQIFYFTYYLYPYLTMDIFYFGSCIKETIYRYFHKGTKSLTYYKTWNETFFLISVYTVCYLMIFFTNTLVPASSPRFHLKQYYKNSLTFSGFAKFLNGVCKDDKSANSFPSGHISESLSIGLAVLKIGYKKAGISIISGSTMIGIAVLVLRYHYFVDVLFGVIISFLANIIVSYFFDIEKERETKDTESEIVDSNNISVKVNNFVEEKV